jgi:hypothetical protein
MHVRRTLGHTITVLLLLAASGSAQITAPNTCASISEAIYGDINTAQELVADVPTGGTFVRLDLYLREDAPGRPWHHCDATDNFCDHNASFKLDIRTDAVDKTQTYHVLTVRQSYPPFTVITRPRLVVTYTTNDKVCTSQGTLDIPPGVDRPMRLYSPPAAPFGVMKDFMRIIPPLGKDQPANWTLCDDSTFLSWHRCLPYIFQVFSGPEVDAGDNASGRLFICTSKPNNQWDGRARRCRGSLTYQPGLQNAPGIPEEVSRTISTSSPQRKEATPLKATPDNEKEPQ